MGVSYVEEVSSAGRGQLWRKRVSSEERVSSWKGGSALGRGVSSGEGVSSGKRGQLQEELYMHHLVLPSVYKPSTQEAAS